MKRIPSRIDTMRIIAARRTGGFVGMITRSDDEWIWTCPDSHRTERAASDCVRRELKRWVA